MPFEEQLTQALHRTADTFEPDLAGLVNAGVADGRRRRRRRTAAVAGGVTALAVVGVGGTVASGLLGGGAVHKPAGPAAAPRTAALSTAAPSTAAPSAAPLPVFTAQQMKAAFTARLPHGTLTRVTAWGITSEQQGTDTVVNGPTISGVFDDGRGPSAIGFSVSRKATTVNDEQVQQYLVCPSRIERPDITCTRTTLADGSVLTVTRGLESPNSGSKEKDWTATLGTPGGALITLDETNSAEEKGAVSRPTPALSVKQLRAFVTDPFWRKIAAELPPPAVTTPPPGSTTQVSLSADRIASTLRAVLPAGLTLHMDAGGQDGYAQGLLNDGHGAGVIGVNADTYGPSTGKEGDIFAGATVLADGTRILVEQGASDKSGKGVLQWTVQVLHKDGRRIVVAELNASAYNRDKDRSAPVLTIDQLKAVALSPAWVGSAW